MLVGLENAKLRLQDDDQQQLDELWPVQTRREKVICKKCFFCLIKESS